MNNAQRGFLLIEVVIAIFVIAATVALYAAALHSFAVSRSAAHSAVALSIAERELENARAGGYAALPASGPFSDPQLSSLASSSASIAVSAFNAKTKKVVVSILWREPESATSSIVSLSTLITQSGGL